MTDICWYIQRDRYLHADILIINVFMTFYNPTLNQIFFVQNIKLYNTACNQIEKSKIFFNISASS